MPHRPVAPARCRWETPEPWEQEEAVRRTRFGSGSGVGSSIPGPVALLGVASPAPPSFRLRPPLRDSRPSEEQPRCHTRGEEIRALGQQRSSARDERRGKSWGNVRQWFGRLTRPGRYPSPRARLLDAGRRRFRGSWCREGVPAAAPPLAAPPTARRGDQWPGPCPTHSLPMPEPRRRATDSCTAQRW